MYKKKQTDFTLRFQVVSLLEMPFLAFIFQFLTTLEVVFFTLLPFTFI